MNYFLSFLLIYPDAPESGHLVLPYRGAGEIASDIEAIRNDNTRDSIVPTIQILCLVVLPPEA